jgi:hypothetical protein
MTYTDDFIPGVVRGISYGLFAEPDEFVPAARDLGAGLIRAYVYWSQVEPEPGRYDWTSVDALRNQLTGSEEVWLTVCSSSPWATREAATFLPPSPAKDIAAYAEFVHKLVARCRGRVRYWQCDNEPSNIGLTWAGTAEEYVTQLRALHGAVKRADPDALVVLGGCGYDVFSSPAGSPARRFFDHLADHGRDFFDVFDIHLYGDPLRVPEYVATARAIMCAHGYEKPIVAGEHGGPVLFEFGELEPFMSQPLPDLYQRMAELPPKLQMFMEGCPPALEEKRHRIDGRQLVVRTVLALASGLRRTAYWNLAPEIPDWHDKYQIMNLFFGKLVLMDYVDRRLIQRYPAADTFSLVAALLRVATEAVPVDGAAQAYRIARDGGPAVLVAWDVRDPFDGEDEPPVEVSLPWDRPAAMVIDAFGEPVKSTVDGSLVTLWLTDTPVFIQ